jgi:hypothetical protein
MQIIAPTYITDATLVSTDIPETDVGIDEWDDTYPYVTGQRVVVNYESDGTTPGVHRIYECLWHGDPGDTTGMYPPDNLLIHDGHVWWSRISATNRWRLFDMIVAPDRANASQNVVGSVWDADTMHEPGTVWDDNTFSSMQVAVTPGEIDTIALMNMDCDMMHVIMNDPVGGEVYNEAKVTSVVTAYNGVFEGLPSYPNAIVDVIIRNRSADVNVGEIIYGKAKTIGNAKYGIDVGIVDYSQKDVDAYGNFSILERSYSKRIGCQFTMPISTHSGIMGLLNKYRSVPLVWIISNLYSTTIAYGFYRDLQVSLPYPTLAEGSVNIEGLGADYVHAAVVPDPWVPPWDGTIYLIVPGIPTVATPVLTKIEEAPVAPDTIALDVPAVPTVAATTAVYNLADTDGVCTISQASPAVVTCTGHGLVDDQEVIFHTTGGLPAPLAVNVVYFVVYVGVNTFNLSLTAPGSTIDTTSAGSGTHTVLGKV